MKNKCFFFAVELDKKHGESVVFVAVKKKKIPNLLLDLIVSHLKTKNVLSIVSCVTQPILLFWSFFFVFTKSEYHYSRFPVFCVGCMTLSVNSKEGISSVPSWCMDEKIFFLLLWTPLPPPSPSIHQSRFITNWSNATWFCESFLLSSLHHFQPISLICTNLLFKNTEF